MYTDDSKDGYAPFGGLFAFVVTQNGALAIGERLSIHKYLALFLFVSLSVGTLLAVACFLRLREGRSQFQYFNRGSILFGKFVFYVSLVGSLVVGVAYYAGLFSTQRPQFEGKIMMTRPVLLSRNLENNSIVNESLNANDLLTLELFGKALSSGLRSGGKTYITWSRAEFDQEFNDFRCELPAIANPYFCLPFLYIAYPVKNGATQAAYRLLYLEVGGDAQHRPKTRWFPVRSPFRGDRIVIVFSIARDQELPANYDREYELKYSNLAL